MRGLRRCLHQPVDQTRGLARYSCQFIEDWAAGIGAVDLSVASPDALERAGFGELGQPLVDGAGREAGLSCNFATIQRLVRTKQRQN